MSTPVHHLIVGGCGAVGATFGYILSKSGTDVSIFVRQPHIDRMSKKNDFSLKVYDIYGYMRKQLIVIFLVLILLTYCVFGPQPISFRICLLFVGLRALPPILTKMLRFFVPLRASKIPLNSAYCSTADIKTPVTHIWIALGSVALREMTQELDLLILTARSKLPLTTCLKVINLAPGLTDINFLLSNCPSLISAATLERSPVDVLCCNIPFLAYQTPLQHSSHSAIENNGGDADGIACFVPAFTSFSLSPVDNEKSTLLATEDVRSILKNCGFNVDVHRSLEVFRTISRMEESIFTSLVLTVESQAWSFDLMLMNVFAFYRFVKGAFECNSGFKMLEASGHQDLIFLTFEEKKQEMDRLKKKHSVNYFDVKPLMYMCIAYPITVMFVAFRFFLIPFDIENFFMYHFKKVNDQMHAFGVTAIEMNHKTDKECGALIETLDNALSNSIEEKLLRLSDEQLHEEAHKLRKDLVEGKEINTSKRTGNKVNEPKKKKI